MTALDPMATLDIVEFDGLPFDSVSGRSDGVVADTQPPASGKPDTAEPDSPPRGPDHSAGAAACRIPRGVGRE